MENYEIPLDNLDVSYEEIDGIMILYVIGEIDLNSVREFINVLNNLVENEIYQIIIECSNIRYIDSSGVGALLRAKTGMTKYHSDKKKDVVLLNLSESLKRVLELTRLLGLFQAFSDKNDAVNYFKS